MNKARKTKDRKIDSKNQRQLEIEIFGAFGANLNFSLFRLTFILGVYVILGVIQFLVHVHTS